MNNCSLHLKEQSVVLNKQTALIQSFTSSLHVADPATFLASEFWGVIVSENSSFIHWWKQFVLLTSFISIIINICCVFIHMKKKICQFISAGRHRRRGRLCHSGSSVRLMIIDILNYCK